MQPTHPGKPGDIEFVEGRLWICRGGTTWVDRIERTTPPKEMWPYLTTASQTPYVYTRWDKFLDWLTINSQCRDVVIPGYGGRGISHVFPGCGHSGRNHNRSGCTKCGCTKGYDSPMA